MRHLVVLSACVARRWRNNIYFNLECWRPNPVNSLFVAAPTGRNSIDLVAFIVAECPSRKAFLSWEAEPPTFFVENTYNL